MKIAAFAVALSALTVSSEALPSEWLYAGSTKTDSVEAHQFFDAETASRSRPDFVRVWIKAVTVQELERALLRSKNSFVERASKKLATGYTPRFLQLESIRSKYNTDASRLQEAAIEFTLYEAVAATTDAKVFSKVYFEIDCTQQRLRALDVIGYTSTGQPKVNRIPPQDFQFIAPDSNGQWLSQLLCQK
jgi:hypothetical protein